MPLTWPVSNRLQQNKTQKTLHNKTNHRESQCRSSQQTISVNDNAHRQMLSYLYRFKMSRNGSPWTRPSPLRPDDWTRWRPGCPAPDLRFRALAAVEGLKRFSVAPQAVSWNWFEEECEECWQDVAISWGRRYNQSPPYITHLVN